MAVWVPSPNFHYSRRTGIKWVVWHSTESDEVTGGAYRVAAGWFGKKASRASAHIVVDDGADPRYPDGVVECVKPGDTAWHAARANAAGYGIEIIGRAAQTGWSDPYSLAAIRNACRWIRSNRALAHIPARWLTDSQLRASEVGHIVHAQVTRVLGGTTHTDPGLGFPFAYVMEQLDSSTVPNPPAANPDAGKRTLRQGSDGNDVRILQQSLNRVFPSYSSLVADGQFGPATAAVVREFQGRVGLARDGVVGPNTWAALARFGISI